MRNHKMVDVHSLNGTTPNSVVGLRPTINGEGEYKLIQADGTVLLLNIVSNTNFFPIEAGASIVNIDDSAVAPDLLQFIYWG